MPRDNRRPTPHFVRLTDHGVDYVVKKKYRAYVSRKRKAALASLRINRKKEK